MAHLVDSSVLIAALHVDDSQHARGRAALAEASRPIVVPEYVVLETATILMLRKQKRSADLFLEEVTNGGEFSFLPSSPVLFEKASAIFLSSQKLSFVDCALLALSRDHIVLTFDKALARHIKKLD